GVRVVDAEDPHAFPYPVVEDAFQLLPQLAPRRGLEIERIDVLVFLGRVLGVLHAPVGAVTEPLGVLAHVRMGWGALKRDVERDFDSAAAGGTHEPAKILCRSELRGYGLVAAFLGADRPRAAGVAGTRRRGVVRALAPRDADRMDGRKVQHVETQLR